MVKECALAFVYSTSYVEIAALVADNKSVMTDVAFQVREQLEEEFLSFLRQSNFPDDSIFRGPSFQIKKRGIWNRPFSRRSGSREMAKLYGEATPCYADLAILDLVSCEYVCLVEFRMEHNEHVEKEVSRLFKAILNSISPKPPVFLVTADAVSRFRIFQLSDDNAWRELSKSDFPHYPTLAAAHIADTKLARELQRERTLDRFTEICHVVVGTICLVTIAFLGGLAAISIGKLILLCIVAVLVIAPLIGLRLPTIRR